VAGFVIAWAQWNVARMNATSAIPASPDSRYVTSTDTHDPSCAGTSPDVRRHACFDFHAIETS